MRGVCAIRRVRGLLAAIEKARVVVEKEAA